jgi:hypothetical protein
MVAPQGNDYGLKLKDTAARQRAYDAYCAWLAKGKAKKSFHFKEQQEDGSYLMCVWATVESYMKTYPQEFDPLKMESAYAEGYARWEQVVDDTSDGTNKQSSVPCLNMLMRNKYKWDTTEQINDPAEKQADLNRFVASQEKARGEYNPSKYTSRSSSPENASPPREDAQTSQ